MNLLHIDTAIIDARPSTLITIDGVDVLHLQVKADAPSGRPYPSGPKTYLPAPPEGLLPPDSAALLPTTAPRLAMIGICTCGHAGCGSLSAQVRRDGDAVVWEPTPDPPDHSIDTTWTFDLRAYLDAVDAGARSTAAWEDRAAVLARELRSRRDSLHGFLMVDPTALQRRIRLLDAGAVHGTGEVLLTVSTDAGVRQESVPIDDSDERFFTTVQQLGNAFFGV